MLEKGGCSYRSENGVLRVMKGSMVILKGILNHGLYTLQGEATKGDQALASVNQDETELWHKRLGHINIGGLQQLCKQGTLDQKRVSNMDLCEICVLGKSHRLKFATSSHKLKDILEYIYSDLWGSPLVPSSLSGAQYFISLLMITLDKFGFIF